MKKSNYLLKKYLAKETTVDMSSPEAVETQYVRQVYEGFGYTFSNPIHPKVLDFIRQIP